MTRHPPRPRGVHAAALALVAVLAVACGSTNPTPSPSTSGAGPVSPSAAVPSPSASGAAPSPGASDPNADLYHQIEQQVIALRGLQQKSPVERDVFDEAQLRTFLTDGFEKHNPKALVDGQEKLYKGLLLMPEDANLQQDYIDLLTSQVLGLYDDDTKKMYVVARSGKIGALEEITYAHEFDHALQDQNFGLKKISGDATDQGDRTLARTALIEGDATLLMSLWAQQNLSASELGDIATAENPAQQAVLDRMPKILTDPLIFPYSSGLTTALTAFTSGGGYRGVDALFASPPDTTEQILHPEKLASREAPVAVTFPDDLATRLGSGWKVSLQDTFGEEQLKIVLESGGGAAESEATTAAAGWGGDRVALVEGPGGATGIVLHTTWDTPADADEFAAALAKVEAKLRSAGRSANVLTPSAKEVVLVTGDSDATVTKLANVLGLAG